MHVALQKWDQVRPRLADDEVIDIKELGDTQQRRLVVRIRSVRPMAEVGSVSWLPWDNVAIRILAKNLGLPMTIECRC